MPNKVHVATNYMPTACGEGGHGPYHPAIKSRTTGRVYYWPNILMNTREDAIARARLSLRDAEKAAAKVVHQWNIIPTVD